MSEIRTRFAPSPTGYMHIGNLRTALYTYLIAKSQDGKFILRIEDTDQGRYVEGAVDVIFNTLKLVGIEHDEGPDKGGQYGPYIQSQRKGIYEEYARKLVESGGAYYCFCSKERLDTLREQAAQNNEVFKYDGCCRNLSKEEVEAKLNAGEKYVIRQKVPQEGTTTFEDEVFGSITVENAALEDGILLKSDGLPTYNFANVIDDNLMKITHVVRGSEYLSSTPKYNLLYKAFGWNIPKYIHLPLIMKEGGKKLSKREGDASFEDFYNKGYVKEAIVNYVTLLGWSPGTDQEFFTLDELKSVFSIRGLNKSPAVFDEKKLRWMSGEYMRKKTADEFYHIALPYMKKVIPRDDMDFMKLSQLLQPRTDILDDIPDQIDFFKQLPDYDISLYTHKKMKTNPENSLESLKKLYDKLIDLDVWQEETIHEVVFQLIEEMGVKNGQVLWPLRTAVSGKSFTPGGGIELAYLLGKEETLSRMTVGIEKLSGNL